MSRLNSLFAKQDDPYAGANLTLVHRLAPWFWIVNSLLAVAMWPFSPIDRQIGDAGWLIGDALVIAAIVFAVALRTQPVKIGFTGVLIACWLGAAGISVMQWLAGGGTAPYDGLLLNLLLLVAATNPLRRVAPYIGFVALLLAAPLVYGGWDSATAAKALSQFVIWTPLAILVFLMMSNIRQQRLSMAREEEQARLEGEQAREEARLDELTGICNRRAFDEALKDEMSRADRMETPLAMAMGDIEHFKRINDQFGHLAGDRALHSVAQAIDSELRSPDRVFRWGGDEFVLLLPGTTQEDAAVLIERVQSKVSDTCRRPDDQPIWIHFAAAELEDRMTAKELCQAADLALMEERAETHRARV